MEVLTKESSGVKHRDRFEPCPNTSARSIVFNRRLGSGLPCEPLILAGFENVDDLPEDMFQRRARNNGAVDGWRAAISYKGEQVWVGGGDGRLLTVFPPDFNPGSRGMLIAFDENQSAVAEG